MAMTQVSAEQAEQSPFYGVKGWILVLYVLFVLSALSSLWTALSADASSTLGLDPMVLQLVALAQLALLLPFLGLTPLKHPLMPLVSISCLWVSVAITLGVYAANWSSIVTGMEKQMHAATVQGGVAATQQFQGAFRAGLNFGVAIGLGFRVLCTAMVTWYLLSSKRVNATFRHRLPAGMALATPRPTETRLQDMEDFGSAGAPPSPGMTR